MKAKFDTAEEMAEAVGDVFCAILPVGRIPSEGEVQRMANFILACADAYTLACMLSGCRGDAHQLLRVTIASARKAWPQLMDAEVN